MNPKISIIIPVYNAEKYIKQCIESIINQDYKNIEIILVDDGSTDNSPLLCDNFAKKYNCIKVLHKKNGGASDALNYGVSVATGDYILFIDSDDFIESTSLIRIINVVNENPVDLVFLEAQKHFISGKKIPFGDGITKSGVKGKDKDIVLEFLSMCPKFSGSPCTKLVKKSLFVENDLSFQTGIVAEDIDWNIKLFLCAQTFDYCEASYYNYRQDNINSVTSNTGYKHFISLMYIIKKWCNDTTRYTATEKKFILSSLAYEYSIAVMIYSKLDKSIHKDAYRDLKNFFWILNFKTGFRYILIKNLCRIIGFYLTSKLLRLYLKVR